jgi:alpha-beta hydrolase superfamily lysophospholipase
MSLENAIQHIPCDSSLESSVILLHGYGAQASVHRQDAQAFVTPNTEVVIPDAPGHGQREDGRLTEIAALPDDVRGAAIQEVAREWLTELPDLAASCRQRGCQRVGLVGISMGGFAALGALTTPCPFDAVAALLAAPTLLEQATVSRSTPPILIGIAGKDAAVPPDSARTFARQCGAELHEYKESEHIMRAEDWHHLWQQTAAFLQRNLSR